MRIGLYGGTFDPVHLGHLIVAEQACVELQLDRVLFVLSPNPPHKSAQAITPAAQRLAMLKLALAENPRFEVSTIELVRSGISYTIDTLRELRAMPAFAEAEFFLIIGADSFLEFHNWREPQAIIELAKLAVYARPGLDLSRAKPQFLQAASFLHGPQIDISATEIRQRCATNASIRYLVLDVVHNYILDNHIYENAAVI